MRTRLGTSRASTGRVVRIDPRAKYAGDPPTLQQQITGLMTTTYGLIDTLNGHIAGLRQRIERLERDHR